MLGMCVFDGFRGLLCKVTEGHWSIMGRTYMHWYLIDPVIVCK